MLTAPDFWTQEGPDHPAARALAPLGALYAFAAARRLRSVVPARLPVPVLCAGNATLGGVGKTPFVLLLARRLRAAGHAPHLLSRGYGGRMKGPLRVEAGFSAAAVGDEALLLAQAAPTWIGADRAASGAAALRAGADVLVMDDGYQNPALAKTFSFLLIDAETRFGNGRVFPAGPLREPVAAALARSNAVVAVTQGPKDAVPAELVRLAEGRPLLKAWQRLDPRSVPSGTPVHAFAGIGRPERFFRAIEAAGLTLSASTSFPDHHPYKASEVDALRRQARADGAVLVTTRKDAVRLPGGRAEGVLALPSEMQTDAPQRLDALLRDAMEDEV